MQSVIISCREKNIVNLILRRTMGNERKSVPKQLFGEIRVCSGGGRIGSGAWEYLAFPLSGREVWRRYFLISVFDSDGDIRVCPDCVRNSPGTYDEKESGRSFPGIWKECPLSHWRMDKCGDPYADRTLLQCDWRVGIKISL